MPHEKNGSVLKGNRMKKQELSKVQALLINRRRDLLGAQHQGYQTLRGANGEVTDNCDEAFNSTTSFLTSGILQRHSDELLQIDYALQKISKGTYGSCEDCGKIISAERLSALPYACYCVRCQAEREKSGDDNRPAFRNFEGVVDEPVEIDPRDQPRLEGR